MYCRASGRGGVAARGHRQAHGSSSSGRHARCQWHWPAPPFCATGRAVGLDVAAVDLASFRDPAFLRQRRQDARPDASAAPPVPAIIDRRRRAVFGRTIRPAATALQHVNDAGDHSSIIDPSRSGLVFGKRGSIAAQASSDNQNNERDISNGLLLQQRIHESMCTPIFKRLIEFGP